MKTRSTRIICDSLGFHLEVIIAVGDFPQWGQHRTHENCDTGQVDAAALHTINIQAGLSPADLITVASHEAYHLFYSVRHLMTVSEEVEAETFGFLVRRVCAVAGEWEGERQGESVSTEAILARGF